MASFFSQIVNNVINCTKEAKKSAETAQKHLDNAIKVSKEAAKNINKNTNKNTNTNTNTNANTILNYNNAINTINTYIDNLNKSEEDLQKKQQKYQDAQKKEKELTEYLQDKFNNMVAMISSNQASQGTKKKTYQIAWTTTSDGSYYYKWIDKETGQYVTDQDKIKKLNENYMDNNENISSKKEQAMKETNYKFNIPTSKDENGKPSSQVTIIDRNNGTYAVISEETGEEIKDPETIKQYVQYWDDNNMRPGMESSDWDKTITKLEHPDQVQLVRNKKDGTTRTICVEYNPETGKYEESKSYDKSIQMIEISQRKGNEHKDGWNEAIIDKKTDLIKEQGIEATTEFFKGDFTPERVKEAWDKVYICQTDEEFEERLEGTDYTEEEKKGSQSYYEPDDGLIYVRPNADKYYIYSQVVIDLSGRERDVNVNQYKAKINRTVKNLMDSGKTLEIKDIDTKPINKDKIEDDDFDVYEDIDAVSLQDILKDGMEEKISTGSSYTMQVFTKINNMLRDKGILDKGFYLDVDTDLEDYMTVLGMVTNDEDYILETLAEAMQQKDKKIVDEMLGKFGEKIDDLTNSKGKKESKEERKEREERLKYIKDWIDLANTEAKMPDDNIYEIENEDDEIYDDAIENNANEEQEGNEWQNWMYYE